MAVYFYIRVSTDLQNCANQRYELETYAQKNHIKVDECVEETISSRKPLAQRKLSKLLQYIHDFAVILLKNFIFRDFIAILAQICIKLIFICKEFIAFS